MSASRVFRLSLVVGMLLCGVSDALAQYGVKQQPNWPPGSVRGEVKGFRQGVGLMVSDPNTNQAYFVQVAFDAKKIDITGEGSISLLRPGMYVRFDISMDKQGNGKEELKKIELFTYDAQVARTGTEPKGGDNYVVAGKVKTYVSKTGKLTVEVPGEKVTVRASVAKDATLDVGVRGGEWLWLAKAGDSATASGKVAKPSQPKDPGILVADEIEVKLVKPLAVEFGKDKPDPKAKAKTPEKKPAAKE